MAALWLASLCPLVEPVVITTHTHLLMHDQMRRDMHIRTNTHTQHTHTRTHTHTHTHTHTNTRVVKQKHKNKSRTTTVTHRGSFLLSLRTPAMTLPSANPKTMNCMNSTGHTMHVTASDAMNLLQIVFFAPLQACDARQSKIIMAVSRVPDVFMHESE